MGQAGTKLLKDGGDLPTTRPDSEERQRLAAGSIELKDYTKIEAGGPTKASGGATLPCSSPRKGFFTFCVLALLSLLALAGRWQEYRTLAFDVVIIGAGPAGSAVAWALAAEASTARILVIEAGGPSQHATGGTEYLFENKTIFDVPLAWSYVAHLKAYHWPVHGALLAKAVGGCGIHNAMLYVRALKENVDEWDMGSFSWDEIYKSYLSMEDYQGPSELTKHHGVGGPMATSMNSFRDLLGTKFLETCANMGIPATPDFNAPGSRFGAGLFTFNIKDGFRASAAAALLQPTLERHRNRVVLRTYTTVDRLELSQEGPRRVQTLHGTDSKGQPFSQPIHEKARVVLTAGAILTPGLLLRSGIGNRNDASERGLPVPKVEIPSVGHNVQDHPAVGVVFEVNPPLNQDMRDDYSIFSNWTTKPPGALLKECPETFNFPGFSSGAFLSSGIGRAGNSTAVPDLQLTVFPIMIEPHLPKKVILESSNKVLVTVAVVSPHTVYRLGRLGAFDDDPDDGSGHDDDIAGSSSPEIVGELHALDVQRLARGVRLVRKIFSTAPLNTFVISESIPGVSAVSTDEELEAWVLSAHTSNSHWCCSARMGNDPATSAVDSELKIRGVDNLYVADASVLPTIPNGNVHSTVVAVASVFAKRLAKEIKAELS